MKSCPACNRTFEDTFTFCLVDGSILSAPFDPRPTQEQPGVRYTSPPPTEVMPPPARPTADAPPPPTVPFPPPQTHSAVSPARSSSHSNFQSTPAAAPPQKKGRLWLLAVALFGLWLLGIYAHVGGNFIHLLLLAAIVTLIVVFYRLARRGRT